MNRVNRRRLLVRFVALAAVMMSLLAVAALAYPAYAKTALPARPEPARLMTDLAGMLARSAADEIESQLVSLWQDTGVQLAVVTVPDLGGDDIEDYSVRLFEAWGIGEAGKDNGLLLLIAAEEREMKFETGYGLEGELPDAFLGKVIDQALVPKFRAGNQAAGIEASIKMISDRLKGRAGEGPGSDKSSDSVGEAAGVIVFLIIVMVIIAISSRRRGPRGRGPGSGSGGGGGTWRAPMTLPKSTGGHSRGSSSGGFGGFGGGRSGGGGAKGGW
ncbi:MAG: TPM domain-containing protein [Firmicutes bacterium]|nr:TPM domain-containing protein [Bacillota bacterium]